MERSSFSHYTINIAQIFDFDLTNGGFIGKKIRKTIRQKTTEKDDVRVYSLIIYTF